jgi:DNA-directed RNA polymerase subunit RPC12/RpoP
MMYQTVIIDGHITRETLIERSTRLACTRDQAYHEFTGMIATAKQSGYTDDRLEPIMLPDLSKPPVSSPTVQHRTTAPGIASGAPNVAPSAHGQSPIFESSARRKDDADKITFLRKRTQTGRLGTVTTYEEYKAGNAEIARRFLLTKQVTEPAYYIVVETPEGVWGTDVEGLYLERLAPWQNDIGLAEVEGKTGSGLPSLFGLGQAAAGNIDNFVHTVICGKCGRDWQDGLRYQSLTVVKCPQCGTRNSVDSRRFECVGLKR